MQLQDSVICYINESTQSGLTKGHFSKISPTKASRQYLINNGHLGEHTNVVEVPNFGFKISGLNSINIVNRSKSVFNVAITHKDIDAQFIVDFEPSNILEVLNSGTFENGVSQKTFSIAMNGNKFNLIENTPESDSTFNALKTKNKNRALGRNTLKVGTIYENEKEEKAIYLGYVYDGSKSYSYSDRKDGKNKPKVKTLWLNYDRYVQIKKLSSLEDVKSLLNEIANSKDIHVSPFELMNPKVPETHLETFKERFYELLPDLSPENNIYSIKNIKYKMKHIEPTSNKKEFKPYVKLDSLFEVDSSMTNEEIVSLILDKEKHDEISLNQTICTMAIHDTIIEFINNLDTKNKADVIKFYSNYYKSEISVFDVYNRTNSNENNVSCYDVLKYIVKHRLYSMEKDNKTILEKADVWFNQFNRLDGNFTRNMYRDSSSSYSSSIFECNLCYNLYPIRFEDEAFDDERINQTLLLDASRKYYEYNKPENTL